MLASAAPKRSSIGMNAKFTPASSKIAGLCSKEACLLLILPFPLLILNPGLFISNAFHSKVDSWIYYGYFLNLAQHLELFTYSHAYHGDRLAFLIPGYLCNRIFAPVLADYVLHFAYYYTAVFSLYFLLNMTVRKRAAFFAALLFGGYYYNLWMFSWNYVDGAIAVYFLLTLLFFTRAGFDRNRAASSLLAGTFLTCMVYTSIHSLKLVPGMAVFVLALFYIMSRNKSLSRREILGIIGYSLLGAVGSNIAFSAVNFFLTGDLFVLRQTFEFARWLYAEYKNPRPMTLREVTHAYWLILPILVVAASLITIIRQVVKRDFFPNRFVILFPICFLILLLPFVVTRIKSSQPGILLMASCQFSYVNGGLFLALGALSSLLIEKLNNRQFRLVTLTCLLIFIAPLACVDSPDWGQAKGPSLISKAMETIRKIDPDGTIHFMFNAPDKDLKNRCGNPNFSVPGSQENLTELYHNVASTYLWVQANKIISDRLPEITNRHPFLYLKKGNKILILTNDHKEVLSAQAALAKLGTATEIVAVELIRENDISFKMVFLEIE